MRHSGDRGSETQTMRIPPLLIVIDVIGTLLLGLGIFGQVADSPTLAGIDLAAVSLPLIIFGAFLMAPLILYIVREASTRER